MHIGSGRMGLISTWPASGTQALIVGSSNRWEHPGKCDPVAWGTQGLATSDRHSNHRRSVSCQKSCGSQVTRRNGS
eukprot:1245375-Alexandrium_andersonii.AAC.1